jgi:hypothetical protein
MQSLVPYQVDFLFLLIGSNPLPNYVAARLLARERATIILLHSDITASVAERLARRLRDDRPDLTFQLYSIPEADGPAISRKVSASARAFEGSSPRLSVGLNYTGGTKPMAAYSLRALAQLFPAGVFSYLDARTLGLVLDPGGGTVQRIGVGRTVGLKLDDIADLHGYQIWKRQRQPRNLLLAHAIMEVHLASGGLDEWRRWLETWRGGAKLPDLADFPFLKPAVDAFAAVCGGAATEAGVAQALGFQRLNQCGKYFAGEWFEDCSLQALASAAQQAQLDDYAAGLIIRAPRRPEFELDLAATIGYQLFAMSCRAAEKKPLAKEHLLEVVTRAGQLGGDEARFAAITLCDDDKVKELEEEVSQEWDAKGKIRVFGRSHISDLSTHLLKWLREANQEVS